MRGKESNEARKIIERIGKLYDTLTTKYGDFEHNSRAVRDAKYYLNAASDQMLIAAHYLDEEQARLDAEKEQTKNAQ